MDTQSRVMGARKAGRVAGTRSGFTLIELIIVVAILAIVAAVAVPNLFQARAAANEASAIATLRAIFNGQAQFQSTSVMDGDFDGIGEYGCFGELAGGLPLDARGAGVPRRLEPPFIDTVFANVRLGGYVEKSGYAFQMWLPDGTGAGVTESPGAVPPGLNPDEGERAFACYAWPLTPGASGAKSFVINQAGELKFSIMEARVYSASRAPDWTAAYAVGSTVLLDPLAADAVGIDGNQWRLVK